MSAQPVQVRKVELPERLQESISDPKRALEMFKAKETEKLKAQLDRRLKNFEARFKDPNSKDHQVLLRQIMIRDLKAQIAEARESKKVLQKEIKQLRGNRRRNKSKADQTKATEQTK